MPDADLSARLDNFSEGLHALARDGRETRAQLAQAHDALVLAVAKLRDLEEQVFAHRRAAANGLAAVEKELAEVTAHVARDVGALALRVADLEGGRVGGVQHRRPAPPDVRGVGGPRPVPPEADVPGGGG